MGRSDSGPDAYLGDNDEVPEHGVSVAAFALDGYEVTVGRFRKFVAAYDGTPPSAGSGAHPLIQDSGWRSDWGESLPATSADLVAGLKCLAESQTWTDDPGANETAAINCVTWFEAFAFCAWDGGRLPTEAEWEYAAASDENRLFPWGDTDPAQATSLANDVLSDASPFLAVGSHPSGNGKWGHRDLAGGMFEWTLDWYDASWYAAGGGSCGNCANITTGQSRVLRGGSWLTDVAPMRSAARLDNLPSNRTYNVGFRCAY